jgi:hypothetical protein
MATTSPAGYSGTPLARKLGIKEGGHVFVLNAPTGYKKLVEPLPPAVVFQSKADKATDIAHLFVTAASELKKQLANLRKKLKPDAAVWVSWPKKSSKVVTDTTEDTIRALALPMGFVDIKVCAVDEVWSGLKLVVRKELR